MDHPRHRGPDALHPGQGASAEMGVYAGALPGLRCAGLLDRQPVFVISRGAVMKFQTVGEARRVSGWHVAIVSEGLQPYGVDRFTTQTGRSLSQPRCQLSYRGSLLRVTVINHS